MAGIHVKFDISPEKFLADLTIAAYEVGLKYGFKGSFVDFETEIYCALYDVIRKEMQVSPMCGSCVSGTCREAPRYTPWTPEADRACEETK